MVKKSRTGKKKKPLYGPQGHYVEPQPTLTKEDIINLRRARRANYTAIALLVAAMIFIFFAPNIAKEQSAYNLIVGGAYILTMIGGGLILYTSRFVTEERVRMTKITAYVMIALGIFGLIFTLMGWNPKV